MLEEKPLNEAEKPPSTFWLRLKILGVKILRYFLEFLRLIKKIISFILIKIIWQTVKFVLLSIVWSIFVFCYRQLWRIFNPLFKRFKPAKSKLQLVFSNRYLAHAVIIVIVIVVIFNSYQVRNVKAEEFGQKNLISLLVLSDEELIEEYASPQVEKTAYLEEKATTTVESQVKTKEGEEGSEEITSTTEGGASIVKPQISSTKISPRVRDKVEYYIVQGDDTVSGIAEKFGISTNTILWENKLGPRDFIRPGQKLTILPVSGVSHQVDKGDNLQKIANRYGVTQDKIIEFNKLASADAITVDQILIVPDGQPPAPPAPTVTTSRGRSILGVFTGPRPADAPAIATGFQWPTSSRRISQYYTWGHHGLDIDGSTGDPIYAVDDGRVVKVVDSGWGGGYGHHVVIDHGGGIKSLYAHTSANYVRVGDSVHKGQTIAAVGSTGRSTGSHLHLEIFINGTKVNPLGYIK